MLLCSAHHAPSIMRGNFIEKGYRVNYSWQMCLKSVFRAHNETVNVWTHFIGFLIFAGLFIHTVYHVVDDAPMPAFPSSNLTLQHTFLDMAQKLYSEGVVHDMHSPQPHRSLHHHPSIHYHNQCTTNSNANFTSFSFHAFSTHYHNNHSLNDLAEQAIHNKVVELQEFLRQCRDRVQLKMHNIHHTMDTYLKEVEKTIQDFSNNTNATVSHLYDRLLVIHSLFNDFQLLFNEKISKYFYPKSKFPIMVFLFSGMVCFMGSTLYHTFGCQSDWHCAFFLKVDYSGISTLIAGSLVPFVWYIFHGLTHWQCFYLGTVFALSCLVVYVSFSERFSSPEYQPYRALCFVLMAAFAIVPFLHMLFLYGTVEVYSFQRCAISTFLYLLGVAAYVSRVPERLFPGKCDFLLQSHQVFHTFIVAAALVWYSFSLRLLDSGTYVN